MSTVDPDQIGLWPTAPFSPIDRLRVLARLLPRVHLAETDIDAGFAEAWDFLSDLERSVPAFDQEVTRLTVKGEVGRQLIVRARTRGVPVPFRVDVEPGFVWMQTPFRAAYMVGMAAVARPDGGTRYAQLEGTRFPLGRLGRRYLARHVEADVATVARLLKH